MDFRTRQYLAMVQELLDDLPSAAATARRLGISRAYLSRLLSGERAVVGEAAARRAAQSLGLDLAFFESPEAEGVSFKSMMRRPIEAGTDPLDFRLARIAVRSGAEVLAHSAELVLESLESGASRGALEREMHLLLESARAALFLDMHDRLTELLSRGASEAELREAGGDYALAMRHVGTTIARG